RSAKKISSASSRRSGRWPDIVLPLDICIEREIFGNREDAKAAKFHKSSRRLISLRVLRFFAVNLFGCGWRPRYGHFGDFTNLL
ncbi:MAG: hypothetical protein Q8M58_07375, partial [Anaerolineales bacterium]|nr:hypothetical protein [Anaerolineales bacterium]